MRGAAAILVNTGEQYIIANQGIIRRIEAKRACKTRRVLIARLLVCVEKRGAMLTVQLIVCVGEESFRGVPISQHAHVRVNGFGRGEGLSSVALRSNAEANRLL